ncbi:MAG: tRNA dihydrouridine synthase DusB [bacterium]|nr:tRNA dihydrouridine synthase DusB [bacterium]
MPGDVSAEGNPVIKDTLASRSFSVGPVEVSPALLLAPMSGVTGRAFRRMIKTENPEAVGLVVTEFISVEGLTRGNAKSLRMMEYSEIEHPVSVQIFGYDIDRMIEGARIAEEAGAHIVDINCGCPAPKVVKRGGGCELMRQPDHLGKILSAVVKAVSVPVTMKMRSGWDNQTRNAVEIAHIAEDCGVGMITVHARTRSELYRGQPDWQIVADVVDAVSIPVVGSGDIVDKDSADQALQSGVSGLMIGRGAMMNPWIFRELISGQSPEKTVTQVAGVLRSYLQLLADEVPEKAYLGKMKQFVSQVTRLIDGAGPVRKELCRTTSLSEFLRIVAEWEERA